MVLESIHCSFGQCVAASIVLASVTLIAFLIKESFKLEDRPLNYIVGFILALIFSWIFVGSVAWLYYEHRRTLIKRRIRSAQTAGPADEEVGLQEEVELEELANEEAGEQEEAKLEKEVCEEGEVAPQELTHEEARKPAEIEVKALIHGEVHKQEEFGRSSIKRRIRKSNLQAAGPSREVDKLEKIEPEELTHEEVGKKKEIELESSTRREIGKHKDTKLYIEFWRSRIRKYNAQAAASMDEEVSKQERIELEELAHGEDSKQEETKLEGPTHEEIRKQKKTKPEAPVEKTVCRRISRVRFADGS